MSSAMIAQFLVDLACVGESRPPLGSTDTQLIKLTEATTDAEEIQNLEIAASSAYGSMICTSGGPPLVKQRLVHMTQKHIRSAYEQEKVDAVAGRAIEATRIGLLVIVSHVLCSCDLTMIEKNSLHQMVVLETEGLSSSIFDKEGDGHWRSDHTKRLVLAAILKLICVVPHVLTAKLSVVKGLLRAYGTADPVSEVGCKLLALQSLEQIASMDGARDFAASIQPAVVSIVAAATNHPSGLLRQAAVDVRNAWFLMD